MTSNKERYKQLCEAVGSRIPLFQQHWWMETVCHGKQWNVLLAIGKDGNVEGALPYLYGRRLGLRYILQPQLTQYCGPWYNLDADMPQAEHIAFENRVGAELVKQLDELKINLYNQHFSPQISNWLPFHWAAYRQTTRYTYRFPSIANPDTLIQQASGARRKNMASLQNSCTIDTTLPPADFAAMHHQYWNWRSGNDLLTTDFITRVCTAALERNQGLLWALRGKEGQIHCAAFVAYDDRCAYALLSAANPNAPQNCQTYLDWQMIRHLSNKTQTFDFEGSMEQGNEFYYRSFGTVQTPYFHITRYRPALLHCFIKL